MGYRMEFDFIKVFHDKIMNEKISWEISGLVTPDGKIISLGNDSKLIGRIFELISYNVLQRIADENGFIFKAAEQQTVYPDFTLMKSISDTQKIAIDIKTTYKTYKKNGELSSYGFTLGSYGSFLRNETKNIMFPYSQYGKHYVIGFIYERNENLNEGQIYTIEQIKQLPLPYKNVEVFVQEKYKISGEKPGSGNTENIGSYKTCNMDYLINGEGPFSTLGISVFEQYWAGYPKYRAVTQNYTSLDEYFTYCEKKGQDVDELRRKYMYWRKIHESEKK